MKSRLQGLRRWLAEQKFLLLVILMVELAVFYPLVAHNLQHPDSWALGQKYIADEWQRIPLWELIQGRWGLTYVDRLRGGINTPVLTSILAALIFVLAGMAVAALLGQKNRVKYALTALLVSCTPFAANIMVYRYCSVSYALSFLLAVSAAGLAYREGWMGIVGGSICLALALSMYQANLGTCAVLCLILLILELLRGEACVAVLRKLRRMLLMGAAGTVDYYLLLKIIQQIARSRMPEEASLMYSLSPLAILKALPQGMGQAYLDCYRFFFEYGIAANGYGTHAVLLLLTAASVLLLLLWVVQNYREPLRCVLVLGMIALLPLAGNLIDLLMPRTQVTLRTAGSMVLFAPFLLALVGQVPLIKQKIHLQSVGVILLAVLLLRGYVLQLQIDFIAMQRQKAQAETVVQQILLHMPELGDEKVMIIGNPAQGSWAGADTEFAAIADPFAKEGVFWQDGSLNDDAWRNVFAESAGIRLNWVTTEEFDAMRKNEELQNMPIFPAEGSMKEINGIFVVKVSDLP